MENSKESSDKIIPSSGMNFCDDCDNMLYISVDNENKLIYYCKNCSFIKYGDLSNGSICVIEDNRVSDDIKYIQFLNKYIKHDVTIPRVKNINCPNEECTKKKEEENQVMYIKYDNKNMKYMYHCCYCENFWKIDDNKN